MIVKQRMSTGIYAVEEKNVTSWLTHSCHFIKCFDDAEIGKEAK